jgi:cytochrome P450
MTSPQHEDDFLHDLKIRSAWTGGVFWVNPSQLAVFDAEQASLASAANFRDLTMPDKMIDLLLRRRGAPVSWTEVRSAWLPQLRKLIIGGAVARMTTRMDALIKARLGAHVDLAWLAQEVCVRSILPVVIDGLSPADTMRIDRYLIHSLRRLAAEGPQRTAFASIALHELASVPVQVNAGLVVRRQLRARAAGRRPRRADLTDPIVELLPKLGIGRAVDAVTAMLTAIAGPPGAVAACLLYELFRGPELTRQLAVELRGVDPATLNSSTAPLTYRFVKEVLRMWTTPLLLTRTARTTLNLAGTTVSPGHFYLVSPYLIHRDGRHWPDPDVFDPDRWLPGSARCPADRGHYVPFGWAPKACIGASIATSQLMALCHLMCTRYRLEVPEPNAVRMACTFAALPRNFHGRALPR